MIYKNIDLTKVELDMSFDELESELNKFRNQNSPEVECFEKLLGYLKKLDEMMVPEATHEQRLEMEYLAECFTCAARDIASILAKRPVKEVMLRSAEAMGITVEKSDDILEVTLPMILPTKSKTKAGYLFDPIFFAMQNASEKESFFLKEKAMMFIEFIYDKDNKNIPRGDHDNKEVKQVIDAISAFVVPDDSDNYLSLCQISAEGDYNHTKVYVMPEKDFGNFFLKYKNR